MFGVNRVADDCSDSFRRIERSLNFVGCISADRVTVSRERQWAAHVSFPEGQLWSSRLDESEKASSRCFRLRVNPWQRAFVERVIGTIRRECPDHVIV